MNFEQLDLVDRTLSTSLVAFRAELVLCATIIALLLVRMIAPKS